MIFSYSSFKEGLKKKYSEKLPTKIIDDLLTFEQGLLTDSFPQKRLIIKRIRFNGEKNAKPFIFDQPLNEGVNLILADNLKGKSSVFKIIKYGLTGDNDVARDIKGWLKSVYLEFKINNESYTSYLNFEKARMSGTLFCLKINEIIDQEIDPKKIQFQADNEKSFKDFIQDFFFKEFEFYHLNWTQKSSVKDKNELIESKASWNTYYESIYLASRDSYKLAYGSQEELIFQMLLGLKLTYPINRLKIKLEMAQFELGKLKDAKSIEGKKKQENTKALEKELEKLQMELEKLKQIRKEEVNLSDLYNERTKYADNINNRNVSLVNNEELLLQSKRTLSKLNSEIQEKGNTIKKYASLISKAQKSKTDLEEYIQFGIFFSNLDITICPHCNTSVSQDKKLKERETKECMLCDHKIEEDKAIDNEHYKNKIESLNAEINGYQNQISILNKEIEIHKKDLNGIKEKTQEIDSSIREFARLNQIENKAIKEIESNIQKATKATNNTERILEVERQKAVLDFRLKSSDNTDSFVSGDDTNQYEARVQLLNEALASLKEHRKTQNEEVLSNFKDLMLLELNDLGIKAITEIKLSDSFKVSYNQNGNWVGFDEISEGEQLRVKIAFYLSIIQSDIKYNAGKHPRLLIIDSPNKEEGDRTYTMGLKKLLNSISDKYGEDLQIVIGTASRELEGSVKPENALVFPEGRFVF